MSSLSEQTLQACTSSSSPLSPSEIEALLVSVKDWKLRTVEGTAQIFRHFGFKDFQSALDFANEIGSLAESANHHPSITVEWGAVEISWWTHSIAGLFINDFIMAARCDETYSKAGGRK